jgi:SAM-dependent methyltransferase
MGVRRAAWAARSFAYHAARNAFARAAPGAAMAAQRLTRDTGRGRGRDGVEGARYFEAVAADYGVIAEASGVGASGTFAGKHVLELGPGDTRAVALLAKLGGAATWEGFDAFDIQSRDARYVEPMYSAILAGRAGRRTAREMLDGCRVHTSPEALLRGGRRFDLVVSRAVLEHVRDLAALFSLLSRVVTDGAVLIHKVDLRAHGIRRDHELDFLRFSDRAWRAMSSHIDLPNRERVSTYLSLAEGCGLRTAWAATTHRIEPADVEAVRRELAPPFRAMDARELSVLGLWLVQVGPRHPVASRPRGEPLEPAPHARLSRY